MDLEKAVNLYITLDNRAYAENEPSFNRIDILQKLEQIILDHLNNLTKETN